MFILGISAFYHDSAVALMKDGELLFAAQEERFTRKKHDASFPRQAILAALRFAGLELSDIECISFYDKPLWKFDRLIHSYLAYAPRGFGSFVRSMPTWIKEKIFLRSLILDELEGIGTLHPKLELLFNEHHKSHAASAFYPGPFQESAVLCLDGVGEWATSSLWLGKGASLEKVWELRFPHSLGLLYSAFTYYTGFKVNSGEYKLMGLAPYGEPKFAQKIRDHLIDIKADGSFRLDMSYFDYVTGLRMTSGKFHRLFGGPPRRPEAPVTQKEMDLAKSIQVVTEEIILKIARSARKELGVSNLVLAGGVALNCVANGRLLREKIFDQIWIQPAAGDSGGAIGAGFSAWHEYFGNPRSAKGHDLMKGSYLGPEFSEKECEQSLKNFGAKMKNLEGESYLDYVSRRLSQGAVVGWFQGRMEFGPRALGNRSILGDPRNGKMQSTMNLKIKFRESFRPFAPAILEEKVSEFFEISEPSPYMLLVAGVQQHKRTAMRPGEEKLFGIERLNIARSVIPAVTHVDYTARVQTVSKTMNRRFYELLESFERLTGCPVLVNTSFNVRGEPIVCTPEEAYRCFMRTEMDVLCIGPYVLEKNEQPPMQEDDDWKKILTSD